MLLAEPLPRRILAWRLKGAGLEHLGSAGGPDEVPFPPYGEDDVIGRVDAVGICYSDAKLVRAGGAHARLRGRDLAADPVTPGHEVTLTVVGVGERRRRQVRLGARYILQPDVYYRGRTLAVGYQLPGALAQYVVLGREVLDGDEGCYLVALPEQVGAVEGALIEPWSCVAAAYQIAARTHLRGGGTLRLYGFADQPALDLAGVRFGAVPERLGVAPPAADPDAAPPRRIVAAGLTRANRRAVERWAGALGTAVAWHDNAPPQGADDVIIAGAPPAGGWMEGLFAALPRHAVVSLQVAAPPVRAAALACDIGRIHYQGIRLVGRCDGKVAAAYAGAARRDLAPGGRAWFVGGAGPMGQMHVLRALARAQPPATVVVTDRVPERLQALGERAAALGLPAPVLLPAPGDSGDSAAVDGELRRLAPRGFDDVVLLAPSAAAAEHAARFLGAGGYLNVFAGVAEGSSVRLPLHSIAAGGVRVAGTTGSPLAATLQTLASVAEGALHPGIVLGALADLERGRAALEAVAAGRISGKVVVLPFARGLGLRTLEALAAGDAAWRRALAGGRYWSRAAERLCAAASGFAAGPRGAGPPPAAAQSGAGQAPAS